MHTIIIFLIKAFWRNVIWKKKFGSNWGCYCFLFKKKFVKRFVQCHVFVQSLPGQCPNNKYPVNTSHCFLFCKNALYVVLFCGNSNSYTVSTQSDVHMCVCVCIYI